LKESSMTSRKKPGVAFWATVAVVAVLVGYPLSMGPACWWLAEASVKSNGGGMSYGHWSAIVPRVHRIYWPFGRIVEDAPRSISRSVCWYATAGTPHVLLPTDWNEGSFIPVRQ
jgi:hypothetical protein